MRTSGCFGKFGSGEADILLGTQMVAKGLDFPRVTLVGVISADTQMLLPDFRASERTFHLLTQVAGRAGRSTLKGEVIIQTHQPGHEVFRHVLAHDVKGFLAEELENRKELDYPPASRLVLVEVRSLEEPLGSPHHRPVCGDAPSGWPRSHSCSARPRPSSPASTGCIAGIW